MEGKVGDGVREGWGAKAEHERWADLLNAGVLDHCTKEATATEKKIELVGGGSKKKSAWPSARGYL